MTAIESDSLTVAAEPTAPSQPSALEASKLASEPKRGKSSAFPYRKLFWRWHKLAGILATPLLIVISITGGLLVFGPEIDHWLRPDLFQDTRTTSAATPWTEQQMIDQVAAAFPDEELVLIRQYPGAGLPNQYWLSSPTRRGYRHVWANPNTGEVTGERLWESSFMRITEQLHRRLLTGEIGSSIVECITGWGIILAATGCYLWWPKTSKALKRGLTLSSRGSRYQVNWRLHNVLGAWFGFILLLLCLNGMVFSTYAGSLYQMAMRATGGGGSFGISERESTPTTDGKRVSLDTIMHYVRQKSSPEASTSIYIPTEPTESYLVVVNQTQRPEWSERHGFKAFAFDQYTGAELDSTAWQDLHPMLQFRHLSLAIHYGSIFGLPTKLIALVACLAIPAMAVSGCLIWWWKRASSRKATNRAGGQAGSDASQQQLSTAQNERLPWWLRGAVLAVAILFPTIGVSFLLLFVWETAGGWWNRRRARLAGGTMVLLAVLCGTTEITHAADELKIVRSNGSGNWSEAATWEMGAVPTTGDSVLIQEGHHVIYDVNSSEVLRAVHISGTLEFARDGDTQLGAGLIRIESGNQTSEEGFDCDLSPNADDHLHHRDHQRENSDSQPHGESAALIVGTSDQPIPADRTAIIRLHYIEGMDANSCPALVCCGGRLDLHGAPLRRTWVKLQRTSFPGERRVFLTEAVDDWRVGDKLLVTATNRQDFSKDTITDSLAEHSRTEEVTLAKQIVAGGYPALELEQPLTFNHDAENEFRGEVANLSRNVVVESADPDGHRGHTMYHYGSTGSISYAEFRHLGKRGVLGRYSLHYHLVGDSMRGSSVIGASIWDSHNRWLTIHGTNYLVVHDCVGYRSIGHGFFLEDGSETLNVLDRNLAVMALKGKPLPDQVLPFDHNDGAGFWWANSHNSFTRNVAVECDTYGFRFEATNAGGFDPELAVLLADGSSERRDIRSLPFVRFEDNESHTQRFFGLNLRGMAVPDGLADFASVIPEGHIGPDIHHSMRIKNLTLWDTLWPYHAGMTGVDVDQLRIHRSTYGIWRSVLDHHSFNGLRFSDISNHEIHQPITVPQIDSSGAAYYRFDNTPKDTQPPFSIVTRIRNLADDRLEVSGVSVDNRALQEVRIGKYRAAVLDPYGHWQIELDRASIPESGLPVRAIDQSGNEEYNGLSVLSL